MTRAAARAAELAARAVRYSKNRREFMREPDGTADRVLKLIDKINLLDDAACGEAKEVALRDAWSAYELIQSNLCNSGLRDSRHDSMVDYVGDESDVIAVADIDGYETSRINSSMRVADQAYEGWYGDYADWN